ncbi:MAG: serine/threonine protein kinase [Lentisphaeria bacterium]|nr:serine/threonine protein kinase [Lentisphaeria bacterium]
MLFCPHCQQLEPTTHETRDDGSVAYRCRKCGGDIPLRRDLRPGEIVAGFEIEEELGRGAMGIVYQARQTNLDREVAIKILSDDSASDEVYVERFFREARAAASLSHPNVVQAYDAGVTEDGIYYFVMEKITGENLELVLKNVGPLNVPQALDVFLSVANALAYAWSRNQLSHGDIKPENIIMRLNGKVKLADFGLARRAKDPELAEEDIRATPAYAPPEIINGDKNVPGFKSDMYSFGATAYHILVGHEPFIDADPMKVCAMQLTEIQTPLSELNPNIPRRLSDLVDALMEKDPENRPACWEDVVSELQAIRDSIESGAGAGAHRGRVKDDSGKKALPFPAVVGMVLGSLLVLALIAGGAVYFARSGANRPPAGPQEPPSSRQDPSPGNVTGPTRTEPAEVRDEAYFLAKWQTIQKEFSGSEPDLKRVEAFVAEAGHLAPAESVKLLQSLHARLDPDQTTNRVLMLRNSLLDRAGAFDPAEAEEMDFFAVADLCETVKKQIDELKTLDASLKEHLLQPEQLKTIEAYYAKLAALLVDKSLTSSVGDEPATDEPATPNPAEQTGATADDPAGTPGTVVKPARSIPQNSAGSLAQKEAKRILSQLNGAIANESERPVLIRGLNALLADPGFTDEELRKDCIDARRFLVLNQSALLPYLTSNLAALKGMVLFPKSNPDSRLEDISDGTFRLRIVNRNGSITQRLKWSDIRREEGEDAIVVTLINSPQLQKLSPEFREFLFVRALFYGVKPDALRNRFDRASGLPAEKRDELYRTAELFREPPLTVEDMIDALGEILDEDEAEDD